MNKAYIVTNKKEELEVLDRLKDEGSFWLNDENPTEWIPSEELMEFLEFNFPYVLIEEEHIISWKDLEELTDETIMYDGRKEDKMNKKYLVTNEFMNELIEWRDDQRLGMNTELISSFLDVVNIKQFPGVVDDWWTDPENTVENNKRLIAIIQWLNGEEVFETQKTYKYYVARTSAPFTYLSMKKWYHSEFPKYDTISSEKKIFDTREEAEKWLIPGYEVMEVEENEL